MGRVHFSSGVLQLLASPQEAAGPHQPLLPAALALQQLGEDERYVPRGVLGRRVLHQRPPGRQRGREGRPRPEEGAPQGGRHDGGERYE